jgi:UTP-glucose-1-phosphate uridylyltransferase
LGKKLTELVLVTTPGSRRIKAHFDHSILNLQRKNKQLEIAAKYIYTWI